MIVAGAWSWYLVCTEAFAMKLLSLTQLLKLIFSNIIISLPGL